mgnify:FL=1
MAAKVTSIARQGWIIEARNIPQGFAAHLERTGVARRTVRLETGIYVEPVAPLAAVIGAFERCGISVLGAHAVAGGSTWQSGARPARAARSRLANHRSSVWLPTLPAA